MTPSEGWKSLDIDSPDAVTLPRPGEGVHVVALVAEAGGRAAGWSARAAIEIARGWGADGASVLLCDLALEDPELHTAAGLDNLEGVSDALLFGTSFQRLGQPLSDGLYLATAGTAVPDGEALRAHPRWREFAAGFREAEALLALYLPAEAPGADALLRLADAALILGAEGATRTLDLPSRLRVLARVGPPTGRDHAVPVPAPRGPAEADSVEREAPSPTEPGSWAASLASEQIRPDGPVVPAPGPGEVLPPPPWARPARSGATASAGRAADRTSRPGGSRVRRTRPLLVAVILTMVLGVLAAGWMGWVEIPGITPTPGAVEEAGAAEPIPGVESPEEAASPAAEPAPVVAAESPVAAFALALGSYSRADSALARARLLAQARPDLEFLVAPVEVQGTPFFRLLAGASADAASVEAVRESLAGTVPGAENWIVRESRLAFLVGSTESLALAERQVEALAAAGIPAHVLHYEDGTGVSRFRVYAGAFANPGEARYLARLLEENGIQNATLTERRGARPE